jgi:hypothetical protein
MRARRPVTATRDGSWLTELEQHAAAIIVGLEKSHHRVAVPEPQALDLMLVLHVRQTDLQHRPRPVRERDWRDPRATDVVTVEWLAERERPTPFEVSQDFRQGLEPCPGLRSSQTRRGQP